jgi:hypothetical protein
MAVTTTDSISQSKFRCGRCGKPVAWDVMVGGVGICCVANEADRALLRSLIGDAAAPAEEVRVCRQRRPLGMQWWGDTAAETYDPGAPIRRHRGQE